MQLLQGRIHMVTRGLRLSTIRAAACRRASVEVKRLKIKRYSSPEQDSELRDVTCHMGSHSVTCRPTQVTQVPRRNPSQTCRYSIYLPRRDKRLSWLKWPVTYRDGLPVYRRSPIKVALGLELNLQPVDHKYEAQTTSLPSHQEHLRELQCSSRDKSWH